MVEQARAKVPDSARVGEVITLKTLVRHRMESGHRRDEQGKLVPRDIIRRFSAAFDDEEFFTVDFNPSIAANPFLEFSYRVDRAGTFTFIWWDAEGEVARHEQAIEVHA